MESESNPFPNVEIKLEAQDLKEVIGPKVIEEQFTEGNFKEEVIGKLNFWFKIFRGKYFAERRRFCHLRYS